MKNHYISLFEFNLWANNKTIESILNTAGIDAKAFSLFSHIIAAQTIWLSRIKGNGDNPFSPWTEFSPEDFSKISLNINNEWIEFLSLADEDKFSNELVYKNSLGNEYSNMVTDIIFHVINHSTYHRGQIAAIVRKCGGTPAVMDYVFYKREIL